MLAIVPCHPNRPPVPSNSRKWKWLGLKSELPRRHIEMINLAPKVSMSWTSEIAVKVLSAPARGSKQPSNTPYMTRSPIDCKWTFGDSTSGYKLYHYNQMFPHSTGFCRAHRAWVLQIDVKWWLGRCSLIRDRIFSFLIKPQFIHQILVRLKELWRCLHLDRLCDNHRILNVIRLILLIDPHFYFGVLECSDNLKLVFVSVCSILRFWGFVLHWSKLYSMMNPIEIIAPDQKFIPRGYWHAVSW